MSSFNSGFPPVQQQIVDPDTNMVSNVWSSWFQLFYNEFVTSSSNSDDVYSQLASSVSSLTTASSKTSSTQILQIQPHLSYAGVSTVKTFANSPPAALVNAGTRFLSATFTPKSSTSTILIEVDVSIGIFTSDAFVVGLYNTASQTILAGRYVDCRVAGQQAQQISFSYTETAQSLLPRTYVIQFGCVNGTNTTGINTILGGGAFMGSKSPSGLIITEYQ